MITDFSETSLPENVIHGVVFKELKSHSDGRGFFREIIRSTDGFFDEGFGQWSHSSMRQNTVKAWHYHHRQIDWWYVASGVLLAVLFDNRQESPTYRRKIEFLLGEDENFAQALCAVVRIPTGVLHGCKVLTESAHLFYVTSEIYNPDDEGRFAFNSSIVPHNWGNPEELIIAPNDCRDFVPKVARR